MLEKNVKVNKRVPFSTTLKKESIKSLKLMSILVEKDMNEILEKLIWDEYRKINNLEVK